MATKQKPADSVTLLVDRARELFTEKRLLAIAKRYDLGTKIQTHTPVMDKRKNFRHLLVKFDKSSEVFTFYFDGEEIRFEGQTRPSGKKKPVSRAATQAATRAATRSAPRATPRAVSRAAPQPAPKSKPAESATEPAPGPPDDAEPATQDDTPSKNSFPFKIFGVSDSNLAYFCDQNGRMLDLVLTALTKNHLLNLAPLHWWRNFQGNSKGKVYWESAIDFIIQTAGSINFNPDLIRGRGAWREPDGRICYHDGMTTIGEADKNRWYIKKTPKDIGLDAKVTGVRTRAEIIKAVENLSWESRSDMILAVTWSTLAPFAGALPWRPAALLTGPSGAGKSTIVDRLIKPLALPEVFSGGETSEAGVRQRIQNDACAIVLEEVDPNTKRKKEKRENLFSLMRQSTSDDAPRVAKGTKDGRGMDFRMRSMFMFVAISPEIADIADDNRTIRINLKRPDGEWGPVRDSLKRLLTPKNCAGIRSLTWSKLHEIIDSADEMVPWVQEVTRWDSRQAFAYSMLIAAWLLIWQDDQTVEKRATRIIATIMGAAELFDPRRDNAEELLDKILDHVVFVDHTRENMTIREILQIVASGRIESEELGVGDTFVEPSEITKYRRVAGRYGITTIEGGLVAIAMNHEEIMNITGLSAGYQRVLWRLDGVVEKSRTVFIGGKSRRAVVIKEALGRIILPGETKPKQEALEY